MSDKGNCYDDAVLESFFATLKTEEVDDAHYETRQQATTIIFSYLEGFYNPKRRHSSLGYLSLNEFERVHFAKAAQLQPRKNGVRSPTIFSCFIATPLSRRQPPLPERTQVRWGVSSSSSHLNNSIKRCLALSEGKTYTRAGVTTLLCTSRYSPAIATSRESVMRRLSSATTPAVTKGTLVVYAKLTSAPPSVSDWVTSKP